MQADPSHSPRRGGVSRLATLGLALGAAVAVIFVATRPLGGGTPAPSFYVIGTPEAGVELGQVAPGTAEAADSSSMGLVGIDGMPVSLAELDGHPIWLIFWKTACEPCEAEAHDVASAAAAHAADGLAVIGIDVWDSLAVVRDYAANHPLDFRVAVDQASSALDAYGVWGAPTHYFIDARGVIRDRYFGPMQAPLIEQSLLRIL